MTRLCSAVCFATLLLAAAPAARQEPSLRAGVHTVSIYASVLDRSGRLVTGLSKDDFTVLDNGVPQPLSVFTGDVQPITIVVMLDRSGSVKQQFGLVQAAAEQFVNNLNDQDRARIGSFSNAIQIDPATFTNDHTELARILHENLQPPGPTPLWDAADAAMTALRPESGRRVVLMFTDGYDNPMRAGPNSSLDDVRQRSRSVEAMLYGIGLAMECAPAEDAAHLSWAGEPLFQRQGGGRGGIPRGIPGRGGPVPRMPGGRIGGGGFPRIPMPFPMPPSAPRRPPPGVDPPPTGGLIGRTADKPCTTTKPDPGLREVAFDSGGGYFELRTADELGETFARVADELHRQYLLGFTPAALDGKTHTLEVRVRDAALTARARRSYIATADDKRR